MQPAAAGLLLILALAFSVYAALWVNKRLLDVPFFIWFFVGTVVFAIVLWPLGFLIQIIVYGHL